MVEMQVFTKRAVLRLFLLAFISLNWIACKSSDLEFQSFKPKSETALGDLFNNTPAIRAAFTTVEANEFNVRLDNLIRTDPVMGVKSMHALGALSHTRPALPQLADSISSTIDRFARYYQATPVRQAEYNAAIDLVNRLLDVDPKAITDGSKLGAQGIRYIGESAALFPLSVNHGDVNRFNEYHFPQLTTWQTCNDPGSVFLSNRPESDVTDLEARDSLWALYDVLRTGFCIYANRSGPRIEILGTGGSGATAEAVISESSIVDIVITNPGSGYPAGSTVVNIDASPGPGSGATAIVSVVGGQIAAITITSGGSGYVPKSDNTPGAYMRNATAVLKNSGDIELRIRNIIFDLENKLIDFTNAERRIADWTVNQSNIVFQSQVAVVDYLIDHVYPITRKDFVFNTGKEILDRQAEHLSMKNPAGASGTNDQYLTEWLLKSLKSDAPKMDDLENFSEVETNSTLYKFGKDLVAGGELPPFTTNHSINRTFGGPGGYLKSSLFDHLWQGYNYTNVATPPAVFNFPGLLQSNGTLAGAGTLSRLALVKSTQPYINPYRQYMGTRVNSLVSVPATYNNELYLEAALKNFYYHVLERYYDQNTNQWALTTEDAETLFPTDPNPADRNLQSYIGQMQYSMRNMAILDKFGKLNPSVPGYNAAVDTGYDPQQIPYLTSFLYTIAAANGYVDHINAPAELTLQTCLKSMGSPLGTNGTINISALGGLINMTVAVTNAPDPFPGYHAATRQNEAAATSLNMFAFELISPGRFIPRTDTERYPGDLTNGKFRGVFSSHQGDIESTNQKTSEWMVSEFSLSAWEGYGPYSVKGRAANGSAVKYENDYYTDAYRAAIGTAYGFSGSPTSYSEVALGENGGDGGTLQTGRNGSYHMYEMIYRPMTASDPCWAVAQGNIYGYARYGWLRQSNTTNYATLSSVTNNCDPSIMVRLDFDTRDEAIRANVEWVLKYKKYIFVIPISSASAATFWQAASFSVFSSIVANGLWGVTTAHRAGSSATANGLWNKAGVSMGANSDGYITAGPNGFVGECSNGAGTCPGAKNGVLMHKTTRFGKTSFAAGDSMVLLDITMRTFGGLITLIVDIWAQIWSSLGDGPVTPAMVKDNFDSVLTLAEAVYKDVNIIDTGSFSVTATNIDKFRRFYDIYFPTNETTCTGGTPGGNNGVLTQTPNGVPDLFENYLLGCGVTARDLPPVPKVNPNTSTCNEFTQTNCVKYPRTYTAAGAVATWYDYRGPSDGKLTGMLTPLIMLFGTMHEDGQVMKVTTYPNATPMVAGDNRDNVTIRNFCYSTAPGCTTANLGYRVELITLFQALASLNESVMYANGQACNAYGQQTTGTPCHNFPVYKTDALTNVLTESSVGLRNGLIPKLTNNKYANIAYIDPLIRDIEALISDNVRKAEDNFLVTSGTKCDATGLPACSSFTGANFMKNKDRLRFFSTKNAVNPSFVAKTTVAGYVTYLHHGLEVGDKVYLTGSVPGGITPNEPNYYFVVAPVTADSFRLSATYGGAPIALALAPSYTVHQALFKTNRFNASVNGTPLNSIPINMMKQFIGYLRTLTSDAEIVAAIKAAIPMLNNYLTYVQGSTSQITLTDEDIDHIVDFIKDTNTSGSYSVDSFLDMLVSTKMDDLNTLRSFNFDQFKTLGSYQTVFDDINDKVNKYFDIDIKKDILYSPFMLGEPTCPGGSANGFYDHNKDGVWNPGTFTFISAAYVGATTFTDTANVNGTCTITTQVPNIYDKDYYMLDMGGVARNIEKSVLTLTSADINRKLDWLYGRTLTGTKDDVIEPTDIANQPNPATGKTECYIKSTSSGGGINFDHEVKAYKNLLLCEMYSKKISEPHYDRNGNNIIEAGEYTDINNNGLYDDDTVSHTSVCANGNPCVMTLRKTIKYYLEDVFVPKYNEYIQPDPLSPSKNYIHFGAQALEDLLAPTVCDAQGLNCAANSNYLTGKLLEARTTFYASTNFTSSELKSVKNVVGNFLYDVDNNAYTDLFSRTGPSLVTLLREFQGDYNDLLNMGLEGFKPNGFMTYFSTNLNNKAPYTSLDILTDVRTLFNTQTMRCYPGITGEYSGGPLYCKKYKALDTFWGQFGLLMDQFSTAAYNKYKAQWQSQMASPYYSRLVSIFE